MIGAVARADVVMLAGIQAARATDAPSNVLIILKENNSYLVFDQHKLLHFIDRLIKICFDI